jgi:hypothetical protein
MMVAVVFVVRGANTLEGWRTARRAMQLRLVVAVLLLSVLLWVAVVEIGLV